MPRALPEPAANARTPLDGVAPELRLRNPSRAASERCEANLEKLPCITYRLMRCCWRGILGPEGTHLHGVSPDGRWCCSPRCRLADCTSASSTGESQESMPIE